MFHCMLCEGVEGAQVFKWLILIENALIEKAIHTDMEEYL